MGSPGLDHYVQFINGRDKLPQEIHRTSRQPNLCIHRRFIRDLMLIYNFAHLKRKSRIQGYRLDFRLLNTAGDGELPIVSLHGYIDTGRFQFWNLVGANIANVNAQI